MRVLFLIFISLHVHAQTLDKTTQVSAIPLDDIGVAQTYKPIQKYYLSDTKISFLENLNSVSGLQGRLEGSPTLSLRGSQSSTRTLVLQEGIPLNFSDGLGFNPLFLTPENTEQLHIAKGPLASHYGRDALVGAMDFKERQIQNLQGFLGYGSFNNSSAYVGYGKNPNSNSHYQTTFFQDHTDGSRTRSDSETQRATLRGSWQNSNDDYKVSVCTYHLLARKIGTTPGSLDYPSTQSFQSLGHLHSLTAGFKNQNLGAKSHTTLAALEQNFAPTSFSQSQSLRQHTELQKSFGLFDIHLFNDLSFESFKADYFNTQQSMAFNEWGFSASFPLNDQLVFSSALRMEATQNEVVPFLALVGHNPEGWNYYLSYSGGFKPPSLTQKFSQSSYYVGNTNLKSEHSTEFSTGFEKTFNRTIVKFDAFNRVITDIVQNITISPGLLSPRNTGKAEATGFELEATHIHPGANSMLGISYLQSRNVDLNEPTPLSPQIQFFASVEKSFGPLKVKLQDTYWGKYVDRNLTTNALTDLGPWNTVNAFLYYTLTENFNCSFSVLNIFDQARQITYGYPEALRTYKFIIAGQF